MAYPFRVEIDHHGKKIRIVHPGKEAVIFSMSENGIKQLVHYVFEAGLEACNIMRVMDLYEIADRLEALTNSLPRPAATHQVYITQPQMFMVHLAAKLNLTLPQTQMFNRLLLGRDYPKAAKPGDVIQYNLKDTDPGNRGPG